MEAIAATRLSELAEKENLLLEMQIGFRKGRSNETALFLLTSQVEKIWKEGMVVLTGRREWNMDPTKEMTD